MYRIGGTESPRSLEHSNPKGASTLLTTCFRHLYHVCISLDEAEKSQGLANSPLVKRPAARTRRKNQGFDVDRSCTGGSNSAIWRRFTMTLTRPALFLSSCPRARPSYRASSRNNPQSCVLIHLLLPYGAGGACCG
jgi:hypothetical protein